MKKKSSGLNLLLIMCLSFVLILSFSTTSINAQESPDAVMLNQARKTVQMLDLFLKTFIVLIDEEYVKDPSVLPAATLTKKVFKEINDKGWYKIRLIDATGTPFNPENNAADQFERDAVKVISTGTPYFERIEEIEGRNYLRAATKLTAISEGCIKCHPARKLGDVMGALSFSIPLF